ncbi:MAG: YpmS family protein [Limosilactobacillus sp.]|nr:YpmS family protein [Limosilactobacillus sp.]
MKQRNWYKLLFWLLLAVNVIGIGTLAVKATGPVKVGIETPAPKPTDSSVELLLNRSQVNTLSANYLNRFLKNRQVKYEFLVGKQYATVVGTTKFMGVQVKFALNFVPERTQAGNVLVRAKSLSVGQLKLPMGYVMHYIAKNYDLPTWVTLNPKKRTILLDLNKYSQDKAVNYQMEELNMEKGQFKIRLSMPRK